MPEEWAFGTTTAEHRRRTGRRRIVSGETTTQSLPRSQGVTSLKPTPNIPPKRANLIAQHIVQIIQEEGLRPGDALPIEPDMRVSFEVGRSSLREALRILEQQGVIAIRPGRGGGPTVGLPDSRQLASTLALLGQFSGTPFRSVLESREYIEPVAAALCAQNRDDRIITGLCQSVDTMRANIADENAFLFEDRRFHELIHEGAQSPLISYFLHALDWIIDGAGLRIAYNQASRKNLVMHNEKICDAIGAADSDRARDAMIEHVTKIRALLERKHPKIMKQELTWGAYGQ